jgi:hypothetical protein
VIGVGVAGDKRITAQPQLGAHPDRPLGAQPDRGHRGQRHHATSMVVAASRGRPRNRRSTSTAYAAADRASCRANST